METNRSIKVLGWAKEQTASHLDLLKATNADCRGRQPTRADNRVPSVFYFATVKGKTPSASI
jgi:hypothetical protein